MDRVRMLTMGAIHLISMAAAGEVDTRLAGCPSTWTALSTGCYLFLPGPLSWYNAKTRCEEENSTMVEIETPEEQGALAEEALMSKGTTFGFWIGLTDLQEEGRWVWQSGREVNYSAWERGQPDNMRGNQDCGSVCLNHLDNGCNL